MKRNYLQYAILILAAAQLGACSKGNLTGYGPGGQYGQVAFGDCIDASRTYNSIVVGNLGGSDELRLALYSVTGNGVEAAGILNVASQRALGLSSFDPNTGFYSGQDYPLVACVKSGGPGQLASGGLANFDITLQGFDNYGRQLQIVIGYNTRVGVQDQIQGSSIEGALHLTVNMGTAQQQSIDPIVTHN
jgi:hypothetical protein